MNGNLKEMMATQLTEVEAMVYLLVKRGKSYRYIAELPFGFTYETARATYERAEKKMKKLIEAGVVDDDF